jgi:hypothetical protein
MGCVGAGQFVAVLEVFWLALSRVLFLCWLCFGGVFVQGLEKSLRLSGTFVVRLLQPPAWPALSTGLTGDTGLTGVGHRSDRCSTGSKPCKFPLCVLMSFRSEGCLLVHRISSIPVATWSWPTWVVESETCVGSRVHLVGASISFEKIFYRLPFTPPPFSGSPFRSFIQQMQDEAIANITYKNGRLHHWSNLEDRRNHNTSKDTTHSVIVWCMIKLMLSLIWIWN